MSDKEYQSVTDDQLYAYMALLGLENLTSESLTLSYRNLMRTQHVDKGGDLKITQTITQAYRILKLCLENNRYVPSKNAKPGPSTSNYSNYDQYKAYADTEDSWAQYSKCFKPKSRNPKYFFKPTKFDKAFQNGWQHPEDADDPVNSDLGRARSRPKKYNNGYTYEDGDEYVPNDRQNYSTKNDGEPRVIRGGLELRKPLSGIELPDNYDQLSQSDIVLNELTKVDLQTNPQLNELYTLLSAFDRDPSFETLVQRTRTFIYLDWAQSNQSDTTQYQNIAIEQNKLGAVVITLPQFEEDDIVDDRLKEGAIIQLYSAEDMTIKAKATVETVDWDLHRITISFSSKPAGDKLIACGHRCNISMAPSRFIYRAFIRGLNGIVQSQMIDYVYPDPQFEETYQDYSNVNEQRISDRESHQQSHGTILFNHNQELAIDAIVNSTCGPYPFLLFGPPGTGKTATLVECIHRITKMGKDKRILVCTPSNMAADVIAATILQRKIIEDKYVFRLNSLSFDYKKRNRMLDPIACIVKEGSNHCFGIPCLRNLQVFRVIITTLTSSTYLSMAGGLRGYFSHILIDECAQATEQEVMIPIGNLAVPGKTTVAMYGDPKQLGAVDKVPVLGDFGYNQSMMERLLKLPAYQSGDHRLFVMLEQNYRTHGLILRPASRLFYAQKLISMKTDKSLYEMCGWPELPNPSFPVIFHSIRGSHERRSASSSYSNNYENDLCLDYIKKLQKHGVQLYDIGIISPYKFQCTTIKDYLQHYKLYGITVNSVEGFQGSERRVIIFLTTRTNTMGFLSCDKRLNTSITRAQQLLIILGDEELLSQHIAWKHFIHYCRFHGGFKESSLMGAPSTENNAQSPPPGFKAITCQTTAPPGFEKPETTGVPVDVENAKDINNAYNNTTEEMKAEYDIDDDHDFDLTCNVRATEYVNYEGKWIDETVENIEPRYDDPRYSPEYEDATHHPPPGFHHHNGRPSNTSPLPFAREGALSPEDVYYDVDEQPQQNGSSSSRYDDPRYEVQFNGYEEPQQNGERNYYNGRERNSNYYDDRGRSTHQYDDQRYDRNDRYSNSRRNNVDPLYEETRYNDPRYSAQYANYEQPYRNGYSSSTLPSGVDARESNSPNLNYGTYPLQQNGGRSARHQYDNRERRSDYYDDHGYDRNGQYYDSRYPEQHYEDPRYMDAQYRTQHDAYQQTYQNGERRSHQYDNRERNHYNDQGRSQYQHDQRYDRNDQYHDSRRAHAEHQFGEARYNDPRYSEHYDTYGQPLQNGGRSSHYYDDRERSHYEYDEQRYDKNDPYFETHETYVEEEPGYEDAQFTTEYDGYEQPPLQNGPSSNRPLSDAGEVTYEDLEFTYEQPQQNGHFSNTPPASADANESKLSSDDLDDENFDEIDVFLSSNGNGTNDNEAGPSSRVPPVVAAAVNERKLSSEDLDDIAAACGTNVYRFAAETSDIAFEEDFDLIADEILEKLNNTTAE